MRSKLKVADLCLIDAHAHLELEPLAE
ncbi:MAG: hypothetical protein QG577_1538, partial [Thermodesulfobacteriota bacterium]|nr:hypothetical protein [Thermodesulfobacteriota bacterium]